MKKVENMFLAIINGIWSWRVLLWPGIGKIIVAVILISAASGSVAGQELEVAPDTGVEESASRLLMPFWHSHPLLLLGELHGTAEVPRIVEHLLRQTSVDHSVLMALEIDGEEQQRIDAFLQSNGSEAARQELVSGRFWRGMDGRSTQGTLALLDGIRKMIHSGRKITVACIDGYSDQQENSKVKEENFRALYSGARYDLAAVLVGNYHSQIRYSAPGVRATFAERISDLDPLSIAITADSGRAWNCMSKCGVHSFKRTHRLGEVRLELYGIFSEQYYHGKLILPHLTPSLPIDAVKK